MEQLTMVTDEREYEPKSSNPEPVTVECPICGEVIEIPQYDAITRSEALTKHIEKKHAYPISEFHQLMLHAVGEMFGPGGIVVYEERAKAGPCRCVEYKPGKKLCFVPGIFGALSDTQEGTYCKEWQRLESPALVSRMEKWQRCVTESREALPPTDGATRLEIFLSSMSECLAGEGIAI